MDLLVFFIVYKYIKGDCRRLRDLVLRSITKLFHILNQLYAQKKMSVVFVRKSYFEMRVFLPFKSSMKCNEINLFVSNNKL